MYELYIVLSHCAQVASMAGAASICSEITSHKGYFQKYGGDTMDDSFVKVIVSMLNMLKALSAEDASKIIDVLNDSPYGEKGTKTIKGSINAKVASHNLQRSMSSVNVCDVNKQHIKNPLTIFTQEEVSNLQSHKVSESAKFTIIVERHAKTNKKQRK